MARPELAEWRAEMLRLTAFTSAQLTNQSSEWWQQITGAQPESISSKPAIGVHSAEGTTETFRFILNIVPGRIDLIAAPNPSENTPTPDLGSFVTLAKSFVAYLEPWLKSCSFPIARIAFGSTVRILVNDRVEGYKVLAELLPTVQIDPEGTTDFMYQINRPIKSKHISGLKLNRLCKWGVLDIQLLPFSENSQPIQHTHFCRVELDLSSDKDYQDNIGNKVALIFEELVGLGTALVGQGDAP